MKSEFLIAITQLSAEKKLPKEVIMEAVESALVSAYKKENPAVTQPVTVKLHPGTGEFKVFVEKIVVDEMHDPVVEVSLAEARKSKKDAKAGDLLAVEQELPRSAGRIAAQTAKQVVLQRLREAERDAIYEEYATKQDDVVSGIIQRIELNKNVYLELGRTEALMPPSEQVRGERYRVGQRMRVYVLEVGRSGRGPQVIVSRTHPSLLKRLFELEVPEAHNGTVEIKAIAREPGQRSKVAVVARQAGIDPVGSCVGQRGIRIQNIVNELGGEKIDVVLWDPNPAAFIANALSPAQVVHVDIGAGQKTATVVVPDRQLSLAIGKEGQNARLAAKLTGWKIDIKSVTAMEEEKARKAAPLPEKAAVAPVPKREPVAAMPEKEPVLVAPVAVEVEKPREVVPEPITVAAVPRKQEAPVPAAPVRPQAPKLPEVKGIRFAEEILAPVALVGEEAEAKKAKKKSKKEREEEAKARKGRRVDYYPVDEEEE
ncbi:MAG: transcription termination/antitermination protein NusA [Chloroflexi bacterium]|nr:transcription termination/antitermination protein NusA [Chloroflexota bacterium]